MTESLMCINNHRYLATLGTFLSILPFTLGAVGQQVASTGLGTGLRSYTRRVGTNCSPAPWQQLLLMGLYNSTASEIGAGQLSKIENTFKIFTGEGTNV